MTPGPAHDLQGADALLPDSEAEYFLADKAYDCNERVLNLLEEKKIEAVIPPKATRKIKREYDTELYKARHLIENFFQKLKPFRAIATRYEKTAKNFIGAIFLVAVNILLT